MVNDKIICTARYCPYMHKCSRHDKGDPDDVEESYVDLSYNCDLENGFDMFIPLYIEK